MASGKLKIKTSIEVVQLMNVMTLLEFVREVAANRGHCPFLDGDKCYYYHDESEMDSPRCPGGFSDHAGVMSFQCPALINFRRELEIAGEERV